MITIEPDLLSIEDGDITLDAGCGNGRHSWEVYNRNHSPVVAFDIDTVCVKKNKYMLDSLKELKGIKGNYHLLVANVTKLPFKDGSFDKIICSEVLEHIPEDNVAVEELIRVLQKDGAIGISVSHFVAESVCWKLSRARRLRLHPRLHRFSASMTLGFRGRVAPAPADGAGRAAPKGR